MVGWLLFFAHQIFSQENNIPIGTWRVHLPYMNMNTVAVSPDKVYAANGASVFYFDKEESSINVNSKYTGLNDVSVSRVGYNAAANSFIIGYADGNIDFIKGNTIINANDIYRTNIIGSKKINHILSSGKLAYISGDYGVVLYDLNRMEVKESYLTLAANFATNAVYAASLTTNNDSIFLATSKGVMTAKVSPNINLLDFSNWYTFQASDSIDTLNVVSVCSNAGVVYAAVNNKGIYYYNGSKWKKMSVPITGGGNIYSLTQSGNSVLACVDSAVFQILSPNSWNTFFQVKSVNPKEAYFDSDNTLWIATYNNGLVRFKNGKMDNFYPNGPFTNVAFRFAYYNNNMVVLAGGYNSIGQQNYCADWFSTFENNTEWTIGRYKYTIPSYFGDFVSATYNNFNSTLYVSSYANGLIAITPGQSTVKVFDTTNSILQSNNAPVPVMAVGETALDSTNGTLWIPVHGAKANYYNLYSLTAKGVWTGYVVPSSIGSYFSGVTIDNFGNKWIKCIGPGGTTGVVVFNEIQNSVRTLTTNTGQGALPNTYTSCITKDKNGYMYLGTTQGIAICYNPSTILNSGVDLVSPIFQGFPLLWQRNVLAIAIDGGNRKWVGTDDGVWLFSSDMTKVLLYFDITNSPLLSNYVMDIKVHELSGEVFFATPAGIVSYRGTSTEADNYSSVKVFPNPVTPGFNGMVGISGLALNASVKITDVAGNLVYETTAQGGTAVWNVRDYNGKKIATGVYLIFCSTPDGSSKYVSKMAVIE